MKRLLPLWAVVSGTMLAAEVHYDAHIQSHAQVQAQWAQKGAALFQMASRHYDLLSTPEQQAACQTSLEEFKTAFETCVTPLEGIWDEGTNETASSVQTKIEAYCSPTGNGCATNVRAKAEAIKTNCLATGVFGETCASRNATSCAPAGDTLCVWTPANTCRVNPDFLANIKLVLGVLCQQSSQAPMKYCVPSFWTFVRTKPTTIAELTTQLENGCDECTLKIFGFWSKVEPLRAAVHFLQLANACLKRKNKAGEEKFCAIHHIQLDQARNATPPCEDFTTAIACNGADRVCRFNNKGVCEEKWTLAKLNVFCHPCTIAYVRRLVTILEIMDGFQLEDLGGERLKLKRALNFFRFAANGVCSSDLNDGFCLPKLQDNEFDGSLGVCVGIKKVLDNAGCCAPSLIELGKGICSFTKELNPASTCQNEIDNLQTTIASCPGVSLGKTCAEQKFLIAYDALLTNIDPDWLAIPANKEKLEAELRRVIAFSAGVDVSAIVDLKIAAALANNGRRLLATGDQQVTVQIKVPNEATATGATPALLGQQETLGLNDLAQTPQSIESVTLIGQTATNIAVAPTAQGNAADVAGPLFGFVVLFCSVLSL